MLRLWYLQCLCCGITNIDKGAKVTYRSKNTDVRSISN
jgi:hypothetical protein